MQTTLLHASGPIIATRGAGSVRTVRGCASVFNAVAVAKNNDGRRIRVAPGAFALPSPPDPHDVPLLIGHNPDGFLGSLADGSLTLRQDATGLYFEWTDHSGKLTPKAVAHIAQGLFGACVGVAGGWEGNFGTDSDGYVETITRARISEITIGPGAGYCPGTWCEFA